MDSILLIVVRPQNRKILQDPETFNLESSRASALIIGFIAEERSRPHRSELFSNCRLERLVLAHGHEFLVGKHFRGLFRSPQCDSPQADKSVFTEVAEGGL